MWIDNQLVIDDWKDNTAGTAPTLAQTVSHPTYTYNNSTASSLHDVRIDYYHLSGDANLTLYMTPPGGSETSSGVASYFTPDYSMETSATTYDATVGNTVNQTNFGNNPELGLPNSKVTDPSGLNLTTTLGYESPGSGFMREISKTLPGGNTTWYSYYGANDTSTNPCTTSNTTYKQAGLIHWKIEPDPDGSGPQTSRVTEYVYDDAGQVIAYRYNSESWVCNSYDARYRLTSTAIPAYNGQSARTVTYNYAVSGNPLVTSQTDSYGTITTNSDLLGRTTSYQDVFADTTTYSYDNIGRLTSKSSPMGNLTYTYNNYNQLTDEQLDSTDYAQPYYDQYGRLDHVIYPNAGSLKLSSISYDSFGQTVGNSYTLGNGTTVVNDNVTRTQSGLINSDLVSSGSNTATWNYTFDKDVRLTGASLGSNSYSYGYGTQSSSCASSSNPNSGLNSNRTSLTINGTTINYCYDYADRLIGSSDPLSDASQYDSHGNMTQIGSNSSPLRFRYDASDRLYGLEQYNSSGNGSALYYDHDANDRIVGRYPESITNWTWAFTGQNTYYDFTGSNDTADYARNSSWQIFEKYLSLPGGVLLTIRPLQSGNSSKVYSLPNIHGDTLITTDAVGTNTTQGTGPANSMQYEPFGNVLSSNVLPNNTYNSSYAWLGQHQKLEENNFIQTVIPMGARPYLPGLARFTQVDAIEGGNANAYIYPADPINNNDLNGKFVMAFPNNRSPISLPDIGAGPVDYKIAKATCGGWWIIACALDVWELRALGGAKAGVYIARTEAKKIYVGQTTNFATRAYQHARAGKIALNSRRIQIGISSKSGRNFAERSLYHAFGGKRAPWLENKIKPPRWW